MRTWLVVGLGLLAMAVAAGCGSGQKQGDTEEKAPVAEMDEGYMGHAQTTCPVMGAKINKEIYTDYEGKRIYFCCPGCEKTFMEDPEKYMKQMKDEGVVMEDTPETEGM